MAFMNQEKKAKIAAALKDAVPKDWKYSLSVRNHSTIVMTITAAPIDLIGTVNARNAERCQRMGFEQHTLKSAEVSHGWKDMFTGDVREVFAKIDAALNTGNFDKSDIMTDYFHVGHYVHLNIGRWDKPFTCTGNVAEMAVAA